LDQISRGYPPPPLNEEDAEAYGEGGRTEKKNQGERKDGRRRADSRRWFDGADGTGETSGAKAESYNEHNDWHRMSTETFDQLGATGMSGFQTRSIGQIDLLDQRAHGYIFGRRLGAYAPCQYKQEWAGNLSEAAACERRQLSAASVDLKTSATTQRALSSSTDAPAPMRYCRPSPTLFEVQRAQLTLE
jgi:hypothetical protein